MAWWSLELCLVYAVMLATLTAGQVSDDLSAEWTKFKANHHKHYMTAKDDTMRFNQWLQNRAIIAKQNIESALTNGFTLGDNEFSDWLPHEYQKLLGFRSRRPGSQTSDQLGRQHFMPTMKPDSQYNPYTQTVAVSDLPTSVNWTAKGAVNPVQNQGQCGDCWAFSACGALEGQYFLTTGSSVVMSEQNLVDCTTSYGNYGCNGGEMTIAFQYVQQNKGIDANVSYPYTATNGTCHYSSAVSVGYNSGYRSVQPGKELALQQAVAQIGPISVGIDAGQPSFQLYKAGVYSSAKCSSINLDHAVLAVGYGTTSDGQDYWLLKNSWGTSWGMNGYMMMARNDNNMCGIASDASFPTTFVASNNVIPEYQASSSSRLSCHIQYGVLFLMMHLLAKFIF